jgi:hypothetical protein|tara:strand:- start:1154 stop:1513 length:360 start_codon:yes stop_codon:yes gene_type:complete
MIRILILMLVMGNASQTFANENANPQQLQGKEFSAIKKRYEECIFKRGKELIQISSLRDAMDYAPLACRRNLLQTKKYLLASAFKLDIIDQLVSSIEEGVKIDLANLLIDELKLKKGVE